MRQSAGWTPTLKMTLTQTVPRGHSSFASEKMTRRRMSVAVGLSVVRELPHLVAPVLATKFNIKDLVSDPGSSRKNENAWDSYSHATLQGSIFPTSNPYLPQHPLRVLDDLEPIAPLSELEHEEEKHPQENSAPGGDYVFLPKHRFGVPFPAEHDVAERFPDHLPDAQHARLQCHDAPATFADSSGRGCAHYKAQNFCTEDGQAGAGWTESQGIATFASGGVSPLQACCVCGGGTKKVVAGQPVKGLDSPDRRVFAPMDKLPLSFYPLKSRSGYTTYGNMPQAHRSKDPVAPGDEVAEKYSLYFSQLHDRETDLNPGGLSVEFFSAATQPADWQSGWKPANVDGVARAPFVDYRLGSNQLTWLPTAAAEPLIWWVRFSGSVNVLQAGSYLFDVSPEQPETSTTLLIDGNQVLTHGQCRLFTERDQCVARGCVESGESCGVAAPQVQELTKGGHCVQLFVRAKKSDIKRAVALRYMGPDTDSQMMTMPASLLSCNPEVSQICPTSAVDACSQSGSAAAPAVTF
ncbi:unnamed protein product [Amoebophrya sp. A120]|nr:unnamed protein product [Amoebophrya sp. A120]|eukprot:GSA120T00004987001.1